MYKLRCSRNTTDGGYDLAYGKGGRKLQGRMVRDPGGRWKVTAPGFPDQAPFLQQAHAKEIFMGWCLKTYDDGPASTPPPPPARVTPPPPPARAAPPPPPPVGNRLAAAQAAAQAREPQPQERRPVGTLVDANNYVPDPFDRAYHHPNGKLSPHGALDEVFWHGVRNRMNFKAPPWRDVAAVLQRELPQVKDYTTHCPIGSIEHAHADPQGSKTTEV